MSQAYNLALSGKSRRSFRTSRLIEEGRTRRHDTWKRDAMDAVAATDECREADGEIVWSWHPGADAKFVML
jgi:hypothetical protein